MVLLYFGWQIWDWSANWSIYFPSFWLPLAFSGNLVVLLWIPRILLHLLPPQPTLDPQQNISQYQIHPKQGKIFPKVLESNFVKQVWKHHKNSECCPVPFFVFVFFLICSPLWSNVSNIMIILGNSLTTNLMFQNQWVSDKVTYWAVLGLSGQLKTKSVPTLTFLKHFQNFDKLFL